jgi:hypothetical protein
MFGCLPRFARASSVCSAKIVSPRGFGCQGAVDLGKMVVHLDRAGLSGLVLHGVDDVSVGVEYFDGGQMVDGGQCGEIVGKSHGRQITCAPGHRCRASAVVRRFPMSI